ncbi:MAG: RNA-binding domain-containing protein [Prolixibacteraceae bacterium]
MISAADIELIVASGEGYNAEFKVSVPSKVRELTDEVCAFANAAGGVVLIGVDDKNNIQGVNIDNAKRSAIQSSIGDITPSLSCSLSIIEVKGKSVGVIEVPSGANKPYVLSGAIYVRLGPNSQKLTTAEQMRDFFQQSDKIYFDEGACKYFDSLTDLDNELFNSFKSAAHLSGNISDDQIFRNLKLLTEEDQFKNGAVLFFGKQPELIFEKAIIRCVAFKGTDKRFIIDDKFFGGPLHVQYQKSIQWLKEKINIAYDIEGQGSGPRKEIWEIPETVFKEAIINSLSHRDYYDKGATTIVELYEDRVEISNPGGLVSAIDIKNFGKRSHSRNPLIFGLFARMHLVEQVGSGIVRMNDLMKEAGLPYPEFSTKGMFTVTLQRPTASIIETNKKASEKASEKTSEKILRLASNNPQITIEELAENIGRTTRSIEMQLNKLKELGKIERIGPDKGGYWKVNQV